MSSPEFVSRAPSSPSPSSTGPTSSLETPAKRRRVRPQDIIYQLYLLIYYLMLKERLTKFKYYYCSVLNYLYSNEIKNIE